MKSSASDETLRPFRDLPDLPHGGPISKNEACTDSSASSTSYGFLSRRNRRIILQPTGIRYGQVTPTPLSDDHTVAIITFPFLASPAWNYHRDAEQEDDDSDQYQSWYAADGPVPLSVRAGLCVFPFIFF